MNSIGIIAEYNPFHKGHAHQLQEIGRLHPEALRLVVMSGDFVQRGEPAYFSKFLRAQWALSCGAHVVIELPSYFATSAAEIFATGAVRLLAGLGIEGICFGSEYTDLATLQQLAQLSDSPTVKATLQERLRQGISYGQAFRESLSQESTIDTTPLDQPNALLGLEYLRAIHRLGLSLKPLIIHRQGSYHAKDLGVQAFPSATALRQALQKLDHVKPTHLMNQFEPWIPQEILSSFINAIHEGNYLSMSRYEDLLLYESRSQSLDTLAQLQDFTEGLHHKWKQAAQDMSWADAVNHIKSKRYTFARLQRMASATVLHRQASDVMKAHQLGPTYGRLLGFTKEGRQWLKHYKGALPIINKFAPFYETSSDYTKLLLDGDIRATNIRSLCVNAPTHRKGNVDFTTGPLVLI